MKWKILDWTVLLFSVVLSAFSLFWNRIPRTADTLLYVKSSEGEWYYGLDEDRDLEIPGPLGITLIRIEDHQVRVEDSPCENKTCVSHGALVRSGDWNACLPNQVFLSMEGASPSDGGTDDQTF